MRGRRLGALGVFAVFLVGGLVAGVVWSLVVDTETLVRTDAGVVTEGTELSRRFASDAWFAVLGLVVGAVLGLGAAARRRTDPVATLVAVVIGSLAASLLCAAVGWLLGPSDPVEALRDAAVGSTASARLEPHAWVDFALWPLAAVVSALCGFLLRTDTPNQPTGQPTAEV